jgi:hypothetical protein
MAVQTPTAVTQRSAVGDMIFRSYTLSGANGDTFAVGSYQPGQIRGYFFTPTTSISVGLTLSGSTFTFVTGGAWAGSLGVFSREG